MTQRLSQQLRVAAITLVLLTGCDKTPDQAREELTRQNIPPTPEQLLASTKQNGDSNVAELLTTAGVDPNAKQSNGMTALTSASFNGQLETVEMLIKHGAQVNADGGGFSPLLAATFRGHESIVKRLIEAGADVNYKSPAGLTPLAAARQASHDSIVQLLIAAGAQ